MTLVAMAAATLADVDLALAGASAGIAVASFFASGLIAATRSTVLKVNVASIFSFIIYSLGVQVLGVDFHTAPVNYVLVGLPLLAAPLARTGLTAELSLVTPVVDEASRLIQTLVLDADSVAVQTRGEALRRQEQLLPPSPRVGGGGGAGSRGGRGLGRRRHHASAMFGRSSSTQPPLLSPLRLLWCIVAAVTFMFLRQVDLLDPQLSTLAIWVASTLVILFIERRLHIKTRFADAAARGRARVLRAYELHFHMNKRDAPAVLPACVPADKTPLLVFVNPKSGGGVGQLLVRELRALGFHPCQIWQLAGHRPPRLAFGPWLSYLRAGRAMRVLVAGGDGTVSWVLGSDGIESLPGDVARAQLPVAVLPLGTGNDLAKSLGWGTTYSAHGNGVVPHLVRVVRAREQLLDRWAVTVVDTAAAAAAKEAAAKAAVKAAAQAVEKASKTASSAQPASVGEQSMAQAGTGAAVKAGDDNGGSTIDASETLSMINYCGFGCGARVALNFHTLREQHRWLFCSQLLNKIIYANIGGGQVLRSQLCFGGDGFAKNIEVLCDGHRLEGLDELGLEGVIILNINSYGGGADLWANAVDTSCYQDCLRRLQATEGAAAATDDGGGGGGGGGSLPVVSNKCDGRLEVLGVHMVHLATSQVKTGLASGLKLAQARRVQVRLLGTQPVAMQVDGEPRLQEPATIDLTGAGEGAAVVLQPPSVAVATDAAVRFTRSVLEWGQVKGILTAAQRQALQAEAARQQQKAQPSTR